MPAWRPAIESAVLELRERFVRDGHDNVLSLAPAGIFTTFLQGNRQNDQRFYMG